MQQCSLLAVANDRLGRANPDKHRQNGRRRNCCLLLLEPAKAASYIFGLGVRPTGGPSDRPFRRRLISACFRSFRSLVPFLLLLYRAGRGLEAVRAIASISRRWRSGPPVACAVLPTNDDSLTRPTRQSLAPPKIRVQVVQQTLRHTWECDCPSMTHQSPANINMPYRLPQTPGTLDSLKKVPAHLHRQAYPCLFA